MGIRRALGSVAIAGAIALGVAPGCARLTPLRAPAPGVPVTAAEPSVASGVPATCEGDARCKHPIDRLVLPRLRARGRDAAPGDRDLYELCRRLSIDVLGRGPTEAETASCTKRPIEQTVDAWLASPEHERVVRREWADMVQYDSARVWYAHLVDLDALVGKLARGEIRYDEMATRFVVHPGFYARHPGDDWIRAIYSIFLGRTARPDEVQSLSPLTTVWEQRAFVDATVAHANPAYGGYVRELGMAFCKCDASPFGCSSSGLGKLVDFGAPAPANAKPNANANADDEDAKATASASAGKCEDGGARPPPVRMIAATGGLRPACSDARPSAKCFDNDGDGKRVEPLVEASADEQKRMRSLGEALAVRGDFWEAAVDREMRRYLGWWQAAFKRPDADLPDVRAVLATELAKTGDLRALERTILTSVLYTMPSTAPSNATGGRDAEAPPWTSGPRKLLAAEPWLDTVAGVVGEKLGSCDPRFVSAVTYASMFVDPSLTTNDKPTLFEQKKPFDYAGAARTIGGCSAEHRPHLPSLGLAQAERELAARVCSSGRGVFNPRAKEPLEATARRLASRAYARPVGDAEAQKLAGDMEACLTAGAQRTTTTARGKHKKDDKPGCASPEAAARWLCTRLVTSAEFVTY